MSSGYAPSHDMNSDESSRSFGALFGDVTRGFSTLLRQEVALAKAELVESAKRAKVGASMLGAAGYAALMTIFFVSVALMWALADGLESIPAGAMIVAVIWLVAAIVLWQVGKKKMAEVKGLPLTVDSIKTFPETVTRNEDHR